MMKKSCLILSFIFLYTLSFTQDKRGNIWIWGGGAMTAEFSDTSRPITGQLFPSNTIPNSPFMFTNGQSNICDSASGKLLFMCNGMILYDTIGNIIENGDSLHPIKYYTLNSIPTVPTPQGSLIIPKGHNALYYLFIPTMTDSAYTTNVVWNSLKAPYDLFQYHIVDMNANNGLGKVIQKNIPLLTNVEMSKVGMMACRHANGVDWWLLKQASDTNLVYTFLVTKDTVVLNNIQGFGGHRFGYYDLAGQSCFSADGSKYAFGMGGVYGNKGKIMIADFDRCLGLLSNPTYIKAPIDSTTHIYLDTAGKRDSLITGVCFSPNGRFLYLAKNWNIYQYDLTEADTNLQWYRVQHGPDTSVIQYAGFGQLQTGIDGRIYIGKRGGTGNQNSVIDKPNLKGSACEFCRRCLRDFSNSGYGSSSPPNMA